MGAEALQFFVENKYTKNPKIIPPSLIFGSAPVSFHAKGRKKQRRKVYCSLFATYLPCLPAGRFASLRENHCQTETLSNPSETIFQSKL